MTDTQKKPQRIDWNLLMSCNARMNEPLARTMLRFNLSDEQRAQFANALEKNVESGHLISPEEIRKHW